MSDFFHPKLQAVEALAPYRLRTTWSAGEVLDVDIEAVLRGIPALANLLDPQVFGKAHLAEWGHGIDGLMPSWVETTCMPGPKNKRVR